MTREPELDEDGERDETSRVDDQASEQNQRVTTLELFFDLVFVFAIAQVTDLLSHDPTWTGLLRGLLVLCALWWAWAGYAWLTNRLDPEEGGIRIAMFSGMAAMLVVSVAAPEAFGPDAFVFGIAYFVVRALLLVLLTLAARGDRSLFRSVLRTVPAGIIGPGMLVAASFLDGATQLVLWVAALLIDYLGVLVGDIGAWRISPEHLVDRHRLVVIIALGESIFAIGLGAEGRAIDLSVILTIVLGVTVAATLWWSYFDWVTLVAQAKLAESAGASRAALARDAFSYLHLPMVAGIVLFAFALKSTLENVDDPLAAIPALALCGGIALYLLAHVAVRLRMGMGLGHGRPIAALVTLALLPVVWRVPALLALSFIAAVCTILIGYEVVRHRATRAFIRSRRGSFTLEETDRIESARRGERSRRTRPEGRQRGAPRNDPE